MLNTFAILPLNASYRFGRFELHPATRQLLVDGQPAVLGSRAFDVLLALVERRERLVTKDELLELAWPGVVVEENNLQVQISALRKLLGPRTIATIAGRGYRFAHVVDAAGAPPPVGQLARPTPAPRTHNLPADLDTFIGRERDLAAVLSMLRCKDVRLVTLTGPGGMGKTRLGLRVAANLLEEYPQGVFWVELAPITDAEQVIPRIAATLQVKEVAGKTLNESLIEYLRARQILLVLDNFEQVIRAAPQVTGLLAGAPGLKILVTSRETLHVRGENDFAVQPLSVPDTAHRKTVAVISQYEAVALFIHRARAASHGWAIDEGSASAVAEICARLDGLPLAIELAAARSRLLTPQAMLEKLADRLQTLTGGPRDLPARQQTIRNTIEWSYELLEDVEKLLFARLAVFVGGWSAEAAQAICSVSVAQGLPQLPPGRSGRAASRMPERIGKYELRRELGRGAMGTVYEGFDPVIGRSVAIKMLRSELFEPHQLPDVRARFKREAQSAGRLAHPRIVTIHDYGEEHGTPYIVMEHIRGTDLGAELNRGARYSLEATLGILKQLLDALGHAHERGVVHRDVKPSNVFLLDDGSLKVVDFGIARVDASELTSPGGMIGTPAYMSPEQFLGDPLDHRSDLYSVGVIFYQLLAGEKPFAGPVTAIMQKVLREEPAMPSTLEPGLAAVWDRVIARAMAKNPEARYASAAQFAEAIELACAEIGRDSMGVEPTPALDVTVVNAAPTPARGRTDSGKYAQAAVPVQTLDDGQVLAGLESLLDKNLVRQDAAGRFSMLETIREYALENLQRSGTEPVLHRVHGRYFVDLVEQAAPQRSGPIAIAHLAGVDLEHHNAEAAIDRAIHAGDALTSIRLCTALTGYWITRGHRGIRLFDLAISIGQDVEPRIRAAAFGARGDLGFGLEDAALLLQYYERSHALWQQAGNKLKAALMLVKIGVAHFPPGHYATSCQYVREGLEMLRALDGQEEAVAQTLIWLGDIVGMGLEDYETATVYLDEATAVAKGLNNRSLVAHALLLRTLFALIRGDFALALSRSTEGSRLCTQEGDRFSAGFFLPYGAHAASALGKTEEAHALARQSLVDLEEFFSAGKAGYALLFIAKQAQAGGRLDRATRLLAASDAHFESWNYSLPPHWRRERDRDLALLREQLGGVAFDAAYASGRAMSMDDSILCAREALSEG